MSVSGRMSKQPRQPRTGNKATTSVLCTTVSKSYSMTPPPPAVWTPPDLLPLRQGMCLWDRVLSPSSCLRLLSSLFFSPILDWNQSKYIYFHVSCSRQWKLSVSGSTKLTVMVAGEALQRNSYGFRSNDFHNERKQDHPSHVCVPGTDEDEDEDCPVEVPYSRTVKDPPLTLDQRQLAHFNAAASIVT